VRFENKSIIFYFAKTLYIACYNAGVVVVKPEVVGLASVPDTLPFKERSSK
jgi:hypothetical protein